jgi:hypothetical protein
MTSINTFFRRNVLWLKRTDLAVGQMKGFEYRRDNSGEYVLKTIFPKKMYQRG